MYVVSIYLPIIYFVDSAIERKHYMKDSKDSKSEEQNQKIAKKQAYSQKLFSPCREEEKGGVSF